MNVDYSKVPVPYMADSLQRWIENGMRPGSFLTAVLANDFTCAVLRADSTNAANLREWALFLVDELSDDVWGSWYIVDQWEAKFKT